MFPPTHTLSSRLRRKNTRFGFRIFACKWEKDGAVGNSKAGLWQRGGVANNVEWGETATEQKSWGGKGCQRGMCGHKECAATRIVARGERRKGY